MITIAHSKGPVEMLNHASNIVNDPNKEKEFSEYSREILKSSYALETLKNRIMHSPSASIDVELMSRMLRSRCFELREEYEADRPQLFFLDMFSEKNLFGSVPAGIEGYITNKLDYAVGEVRFIGDKTDDWPTTGGRSEEPKLNRVKYYAKSVEYGILELWNSAVQGRDIVAERVNDAYRDMDFFLDVLIAQGAPNHDIYGFLDHPDIQVNVVPATTGPNAPATEWPSKSPSEIIFDLNAMLESTRSATKYNETADTLILSDKRYIYANGTEIGTNGDFVLQRWLENQSRSQIKGLENIIPFVPYDTAGPGDTPIAMAGNFDRRNIEMPLVDFGNNVAVFQTPTESKISSWKIGFVAGAGSVNIKREGRFQQFNGI